MVKESSKKNQYSKKTGIGCLLTKALIEVIPMSFQKLYLITPKSYKELLYLKKRATLADYDSLT